MSGLNVFPIKSCQPQPVQEVAIDAWGVAGDRRLMVVDGTGRFVSQRRFSQLATVSVQDEGAGQLRVSAPDAERDLCLVPRQDGPRSECSVWESRVGVVDQGEEAGHWFSELLGTGPSSLRLVASAEHSPGFLRQVGNLPPALRARLPPAPLALADAGPISLISAESLADLNGRLRERCGHEVGLDRFRMNVEVSGCGQPFQEDEWLLVRIGTVPFLAYASAEVREPRPPTARAPCPAPHSAAR